MESNNVISPNQRGKTTEMIPRSDLDKLNSKDPKIKYGFAKELLKIGTDKPELLYGHFDYWSQLMTSDNNVLKWTAIDIIGYLSAVDTENKTDSKINELVGLLHHGVLITCNHAIFALGLIVKNKPEYKGKIVRELIAVSKDNFDTEECKNIATGKVLDSIKPFIADIKDYNGVIEFIENATKNKRNSTRKKAEQLMRKIKKI